MKADAFEQCKGVADDAAEGILIGFARNSRRLGLAAGVTALQDACARVNTQNQDTRLVWPTSRLARERCSSEDSFSSAHPAESVGGRDGGPAWPPEKRCKNMKAAS